MAPHTPSLQPMPPPGLVLFPGFTALKQEAFIMKQTHKHFTRDSWAATFMTPSYSPGQPFLELDEETKRTYVVRNVSTGQPVMKVTKEEHCFHPNVYRGFMTGQNGREEKIWECEIESHLTRHTDYNLTIFPPMSPPFRLVLQNKILGQSKGILYNGIPVATMDEPKSKSKREDHIYVAAGMDILLALGMALVHANKQQDDRAAGSAAGAAGGAGA